MPRRKPPKKKTYTDEQLVTFIAAALTMKATAQATAQQVAVALSIPTATVLVAVSLAFGRPVPTPGTITVSHTALTESDRLEAYFRANYILAASRRLDEKFSRGIPRRVALQQEKTFFNQHLEAARVRRKAAKQVDTAAARYGATLGWHATLDTRTSPECRAANGKNFEALRKPDIGYPGSVHSSCRCRAGKPFNTKLTVYSMKVKVA